MTLAANSNITSTSGLYLLLRTLLVTEPVIKKHGSFSFLNNLNPNNTFFKEKLNQYNEVNEVFLFFLVDFNLKTGMQKLMQNWT